MIRVVETEIMFKLHNSSFHNQSLSHFRSTYEGFCTHENTPNDVMDEVSWLLAGCELSYFFPPVRAVQNICGLSAFYSHTRDLHES